MRAHGMARNGACRWPSTTSMVMAATTASRISSCSARTATARHPTLRGATCAPCHGYSPRHVRPSPRSLRRRHHRPEPRRMRGRRPGWQRREEWRHQHDGHQHHRHGHHRHLDSTPSASGAAVAKVDVEETDFAIDPKNPRIAKTGVVTLQREERRQGSSRARGRGAGRRGGDGRDQPGKSATLEVGPLEGGHVRVVLPDRRPQGAAA